MNRKDTRIQRQTRIRRKIVGETKRARLSVSRSNKYCYAQIIAPTGKTVISISEKALLGKTKIAPMELAKQLGAAIAKLALENKITEVVFDKGRFAYHGRVKAIAEGAREGGLSF